MGTHGQRCAKGPIDRSSDTDSIFRLYRTIQSVDAKFRFLYRFVLSSDSLIDRSCFLVLSSDFCIWRLCRSVLSSDSLINRSWFLVLSSDFCIVRLCRPVLSKTSLYRYWERRLWAVWWSFIIWPRIYTESQHMTIDHLHYVKYSTYMRSPWWANQNIHLLYDLLVRGSMTVKITFTCCEKYVHVTILYLLIIVIVVLVILNVFHTHRETDKF
jgi:hypothetical protein